MAKKKTSMFPDQPAENKVHAGEEIFMAEKLLATSSMSADGKAADDARREPEMDDFAMSPYARCPVVIDCGPGLACYHVPKHLLRSPKWSTTDAGETIELPDVSAAVGHTLVHYLYTGTYQALETNGKDVASPTYIKFEQAMLAFVLASAYELPDFEGLAKEQIKTIGGSMALDEVLETAKKWFPKMAPSWFHEYLQTRVKDQFNLDYRYFTDKVYIESVGDGKLQSFMTCYLLGIFTKKLTYTMQRGENRCLGKERAELVVDGVKDGAEEIQMSFEFVDASYEDTVAIDSLRDPAWDETPRTPPECAPVPSPGPEPLAESECQPKPASDLPYTEEEGAGREKKEEEEAKVTAATSAAIDLKPAEPTLANDDWRLFAATATGKKNGKKGTLIEESSPEPESTPARKPGKKEDDPWAFSFSSTIKSKKKKKGAVEDSLLEPEPPVQSGLLPELEPAKQDDPRGLTTTMAKKSKKKKGKGEPKIEGAPPLKAEPELAPVLELTSPPEPEPVKEEPAIDPFAGLSRSQKKNFQEKIKKETKEAEAKEEEEAKRKDEQYAAIEIARQAEEAEAEAKRIRLEEVEEAAAAAAATEKKHQKDEEAPAAAAATEAEEKKEETWGDRGATITTMKKKKKKRSAKEEPKVEEPPPPPSEPEPEVELSPELIPAPEPAEEKNNGDDQRLISMWSGGKKNKKGKYAEPDPLLPPPESPAIEVAVQEPYVAEEAEAKIKNERGKSDNSMKSAPVEEKEKSEMEVPANEEDKRMQEFAPVTSIVLCPRRSRHFSEGDGWKSCKRCRMMIREFAAQLE